MSKRSLDRKAHETYAKRYGYFWLPCPICGEEFGGHEWAAETSWVTLPTGRPGVRQGVCSACSAAIIRLGLAGNDAILAILNGSVESTENQ